MAPRIPGYRILPVVAMVLSHPPHPALGKWSPTTGLSSSHINDAAAAAPSLLYTALRGGGKLQQRQRQRQEDSVNPATDECINATLAFDLTVPNDEILADARDQATVQSILSTCPQGIVGEEVACVVDYLQTEGHYDYEQSCLDSMGQVYYWSLTFQCYSKSSPETTTAFVSLMNEVGCYDPDACSLKDSIAIAGDLHLSYYALYESILNETVTDFVCTGGSTLVSEEPVTLEDMNITIMMMEEDATHAADSGNSGGGGGGGGEDNTEDIVSSSGGDMNTTATSVSTVNEDLDIADEEEDEMPVVLEEEDDEEEELGSATNSSALTAEETNVDLEEDFTSVVLEAEGDELGGSSSANTATTDTTNGNIIPDNMEEQDQIPAAPLVVETEDEDEGIGGGSTTTTNMTTANGDQGQEVEEDQVMLEEQLGASMNTTTSHNQTSSAEEVDPMLILDEVEEDIIDDDTQEEVTTSINKNLH